MHRWSLGKAVTLLVPAPVPSDCLVGLQRTHKHPLKMSEGTEEVVQVGDQTQGAGVSTQVGAGMNALDRLSGG